MYVILAKELIDVDPTEFEKVGRFDSNIIAMPHISICIGLRGGPSTVLDRVEDCQNSFFVTFEPPYHEGGHEEALLTDPFRPGILYRRSSRDYAELRYTHELGLLSFTAYFLVAVEDCAFGYEEENDVHMDLDIVELWRRGLIIEIK